MKKLKIYVVGGANHYANWMQGQVVDNMEDANICCFSGGEDVCPALYKAKTHYTTSFSRQRDDYEQKEFNKARGLGKHLIGICRGAQFLCVMSGGKLVQDQQNTSFIHKINTYDNKVIRVSSTHHQAQHPWNLPEDQFKILGWSKGLSQYHDGEAYGEEIVNGVAPDSKEVEVAYYNKTKALCIQGHPEMLYNEFLNEDNAATEMILWCRHTLNKHLDNML